MAAYKNGLLSLKTRIEKKADEFELCTLNFGLDCYGFIIKWYENYLKNLRQIGE